MKYWVGVVSKDHVQRGIEKGIAQLGHGKHRGLARLQAGDGFVYYSPKLSLNDKNPLQAFTAIGIVTDNDIWQADDGDFKPWRRKITYKAAQDAPIRPLLSELSFIKNKSNWGYVFRLGLIEITEEDFKIITAAMQITN